jgi:hypothetical protein
VVAAGLGAAEDVDGLGAGVLALALGSGAAVLREGVGAGVVRVGVGAGVVRVGAGVGVGEAVGLAVGEAVGLAEGDAVGAGVVGAGAEPPPELDWVAVGVGVGIAAPLTSMLTLTILDEVGRSASVIAARRKVIEVGAGVLKAFGVEATSVVRSFAVRTVAPAGTTSMRNS